MRELYKRKISNGAIINATLSAKEYADSLIEKAKMIAEDPDRKERLEACECPVCWKNGRIGGSVCTPVICATCDTVLYSGNTCVDAMCLQCAKKIGVCKRCCADLDLKQRRKLWIKSDDTE